MILNLLEWFVVETIFLFNEMALFLLLGFFLAGVIHAFLPGHRIQATPGGGLCVSDGGACHQHSQSGCFMENDWT